MTTFIDNIETKSLHYLVPTSASSLIRKHFWYLLYFIHLERQSNKYIIFVSNAFCILVPYAFLYLYFS